MLVWIGRGDGGGLHSVIKHLGMEKTSFPTARQIRREQATRTSHWRGGANQAIFDLGTVPWAPNDRPHFLREQEILLLYLYIAESLCVPGHLLRW